MDQDAFYALKGGFRRLVKAVGGVEAAEQIAKVSKASISKWQSIDHECFPPLNVILLLEWEVGSPVCTRDLLRLQGYVAVSGEGQYPKGDNLHMPLLNVVKELGEAAAAIGQRNHFACMAEFQAVEREVFDVKTAADRLLDETRRRRPGFRGELRVAAE